MTKTERQIADFLAPYDEDIRTFAQDLRAYLKKETKPAIELAGMSAQSFNIGYGFTTTAWDCYCAIIVYRKHINISLPSGASLTDPDGLLHGTGSRIRHFKVKELADLKIPTARELLKEARKNARSLLLRGASTHKGVKTVVKIRGAKK
jgi:hypothetical protein